MMLDVLLYKYIVYFCDVFDGEILNGYRNGEWKFSAISNLV